MAVVQTADAPRRDAVTRWSAGIHRLGAIAWVTILAAHGPIFLHQLHVQAVAIRDGEAIVLFAADGMSLPYRKALWGTTGAHGSSTQVLCTADSADAAESMIMEATRWVAGMMAAMAGIIGIVRNVDIRKSMILRLHLFIPLRQYQTAGVLGMAL